MPHIDAPAHTTASGGLSISGDLDVMLSPDSSVGDPTAPPPVAAAESDLLGLGGGEGEAATTAAPTTSAAAPANGASLLD